MPSPVPSWNLVRLHGNWFNMSDGTRLAGNYTVDIDSRLTNATDDAIIPAGRYAAGPLQTTGSGNFKSLDIMVPATDDPDIEQTGFTVKVTVEFTGVNGTKPKAEVYSVTVPYAQRPTADGGTGLGVNLRTIAPSAQIPQSNPLYKVGVPGGLAKLNQDGDVVDSDGQVVTGGGTSAWSGITGKPAVIAAGADQAAAREAIGAGTSSLALGASGSTSGLTAVAGSDTRLSDPRTPLDSSVTSAKIADGTIVNTDISGTAAIDLTKTVDGTTRKALTTGTQTISGAKTFDTAPVVPAGAFNSSVIADLAEFIQDTVAASLLSGGAAVISYDDPSGKITISAPASGGLDAEGVRDTIGVALLGTGLITVTANDAADTITLSTTATANATDAQLRDRSTHTGSQLASTVSDLTEAVQDIVGAFVAGTGGITATYNDAGNTLTLTIADGALTIAKTSGLQTALDAKMAAAALANSCETWTVASARGARPSLPTGMRYTVYGATAAQAQSVADGTALTWLLNGDKVEVTA